MRRLLIFAVTSAHFPGRPSGRFRLFGRVVMKPVQALGIPSETVRSGRGLRGCGRAADRRPYSFVTGMWAQSTQSVPASSRPDGDDARAYRYLPAGLHAQGQLVQVFVLHLLEGRGFGETLETHGVAGRGIRCTGFCFTHIFFAERSRLVSSSSESARRRNRDFRRTSGRKYLGNFRR